MAEVEDVYTELPKDGVLLVCCVFVPYLSPDWTEAVLSQFPNKIAPKAL